MDYQQAQDYILSFADFERSGHFRHRPDLAPVLSLLERLGNPHLGRATIHVAGSKGKGSVAAMLESILQAAGLNTGLFTSPHLHSLRERIRLNGQPISEPQFARLVEQLHPAAEAEMAVSDQRQLVTFDLLTALAFLAFRQAGLDVQVIEVGLGGRLDSTNVFPEKEACVITPISLEHTAILGDSVEMIAREKAAIVRPGSLVIMSPQPYAEAEAVIRQEAEEAGCLLIDVARDYRWRRLCHDLAGQSFQLSGPGGVLELWLPLLGGHQLENAATAVACLEGLQRCGLFVSPEAVRQGLAQLRWSGRLEVLSRQPLIIIDGAHNCDSARRLREALADYFSCQEAFLIIGTLQDKDITAIAQELAPLAGRVLAPRFHHPRALEPQRVVAAFRELGCLTEAFNTVGEAVGAALAQAGPDSIICAVGALSFAAAVREQVLGQAAVTV